MVNMYDFITLNASYFDQLKFGEDEDVFIDYHCPLTDYKSKVWSHKNCLMYVVEGIKEYTSQEHYHRSNEGEVLFIRKGGYILGQNFEKPYHALIFMFGDDAIKRLLIEFPKLLKIERNNKNAFLKESEILLLQGSEIIRSIFLSCLMYVQDQTEESRVAIALKFKELLINLLRKKEDNGFYHYLSWLSLDDEVAFIKLMQDNSHLNFTTAELARTTGMSLSTFKRTFNKYFGQPPGKWLHNQRMNRAKSMLGNPQLNISDIAFELGYNDAATFSKAFKADTGMSPSEFLR